MSLRPKAAPSKAVVAVMAILVASMLVFAACGGGDDSGSDSGTTATTTETSTTKTQEKSGGDKTASAGQGKELFNQNCASCHTLSAAGASGSVGPNLDDLKPSASETKSQVENGGSGMPAFKDQLSAEQIDAVSAYVADNAGK